MALTRSFLKAMGITEEQISSIIEAHTESTDALKKQRDEAKAIADTADALSKELQSVKAELVKAQQNGTDTAKVQAEFDAYKAQIAGEKANMQKASAVRALLHESGVQRDQLLNLLMDKVDLSGVELQDGKVKDAESFVNRYKTEYSDLFSIETHGGTPPMSPPSGGGKDTSQMTDDEYYKYMLEKEGK